jgi:hypothetical protein
MTQEALEKLIGAYIGAWSEPDAARRRALLEQAWEVDGVYTDPQTHAVGRDALDAHIGGFQASAPGATFALNGAVDHHHDHVHFSWTLTLPGGQEVPGMDYGELSPSGKLSKIVGFF